MATRTNPAPSASRIRRWAGATLGDSAEIAVRIVGAAEARRLNLRYRGRNYATNVLSFAYGKTDGALCGDVVLCMPVIAREARDQRKTLDAHLAHLTVHGLLHLQGHDHQNLRSAARMEALERKILAKLGYADPYGTRGPRHRARNP